MCNGAADATTQLRPLVSVTLTSGLGYFSIDSIAKSTGISNYNSNGSRMENDTVSRCEVQVIHQCVNLTASSTHMEANNGF